MSGAPDVAAKADLTFRQVDYWTRAGYLKPAVQLPGSGYPREYPEDQVLLAQVMAGLVRVGLPPAKAHGAALQIIDHGTALLGGFAITPAPRP